MSSAQDPVNNFVRRAGRAGFGMAWLVISGYSAVGFPAPAGQVC
jgi:hypothetical protein